MAKYRVKRSGSETVYYTKRIVLKRRPLVTYNCIQNTWRQRIQNLSSVDGPDHEKTIATSGPFLSKYSSQMSLYLDVEINGLPQISSSETILEIL